MSTGDQEKHDGNFSHTFSRNPLVGEENFITMNNVGDVLAFISRTLTIQYEAHHCPDFDLAPFTHEEYSGLAQIHKLLEHALRHDAPPVLFTDDAGRRMLKD